MRSEGWILMGVLFRITEEMLADFDRREVGYDRVEIKMEDIELLARESSSDKEKEERQDKPRMRHPTVKCNIFPRNFLCRANEQIFTLTIPCYYCDARVSVANKWQWILYNNKSTESLLSQRHSVIDDQGCFERSNTIDVS
jgi:hypothetical protein